MQEPAKPSKEEPVDDKHFAETQKLDGPVVAEAIGKDQAFNEDSIVEALPEKNAEELDQSFIEELEDSLSKEINRDLLNG